MKSLFNKICTVRLGRFIKNQKQCRHFSQFMNLYKFSNKILQLPETILVQKKLKQMFNRLRQDFKKRNLNQEYFDINRPRQSFNKTNLNLEYSDRQYRANMRNHLNFMNFQTDEFSFKLNDSRAQEKLENEYFSQTNTLSLRQNLFQLDKQQIISILLEQIKSKPQKDALHISNKMRSVKMISERPLLEQMFPQNTTGNQTIYKRKYEQLVDYFQEYITNTNEAQSHYMKAIEDLKQQSKGLSQSSNKPNSRIPNIESKNSSFSSTNQLVNIQKSTLIHKLQQTVQNYLSINNVLLNKVQKLQRLRKQQSDQNKRLRQQILQANLALKNQNVLNQKITRQNQEIIRENQEILNQNQRLSNENNSFKHIIDELKDYIHERRQAKQLAEVEHNQKIQQLPNQYCYHSLKKQNSAQNQSCYDSIINRSSIKNRQIFHDSSVIILNENSKNPDKNGQKLYINDFKSNQSNCFERKLQSISSDNDVSISTFRQFKISNKELRQTNCKLQGLIERKSQKIMALLEQIQQISYEKDQINQQLINLKQKVSLNSDQFQKMSLQSKFSRVTTIHQGKDENCSSHENRKQIFFPGVNMVSSSIYELKNSQSSSKISTTYEPNYIKEQKSFKLKELQPNKASPHQKEHQREESRTLKDSSKEEDYYIAKSLFFSNKKPDNQLCASTKCFQVKQEMSSMKKKSKPYQVLKEGQQNLEFSKQPVSAYGKRSHLESSAYQKSKQNQI